MNDSRRRINKDVQQVLKQEEAFKGTVKEGFERRFTVINERDRKRYLTQEQNDELDNSLFYHLGKIEDGRVKDGKEPFNNYVVINLDEPYADEVIEIMKRHGHWG